MSVRVMSAVWESTVQPTAARFVLLALADNANDAGLCKPGTAYLAGKTGMSRRSVFRALSELETDGLLQRRERTRPNGSRTASAYRIDVAELQRRRRVEVAEERDELEALFDDDQAPPYDRLARGPMSQSHNPPDVVAPPEPSLEPTKTLVANADASDDQQPPHARPDVDRLCEQLADRIAANGAKRPKINDAWRAECRRMLDRDGRDEDEARRLIDWCQADPFWLANILSMPTFRKQYDKLLLKAKQTPAWLLSAPPDLFSLADGDVDDLLANERPPHFEAPEELEVGSLAWQDWQRQAHEDWRRRRVAELTQARRRA